MSDIFISYAREDLEKVEILVDALKLQNYSVWWDPSIPVGETFLEVIEKELAKASCVVVVWSEASLRSRWVKLEGEQGIKRGIYTPVLIEKVDLPFGFDDIQAADLTNLENFEVSHEFERLLEAINSKLSVEVPSPHLNGVVEKETSKGLINSITDVIKAFVIKILKIFLLFFIILVIIGLINKTLDNQDSKREDERKADRKKADNKSKIETKLKIETRVKVEPKNDLEKIRSVGKKIEASGEPLQNGTKLKVQIKSKNPFSKYKITGLWDEKKAEEIVLSILNENNSRAQNSVYKIFNLKLISGHIYVAVALSSDTSVCRNCAPKLSFIEFKKLKRLKKLKKGWWGIGAKSVNEHTAAKPSIEKIHSKIIGEYDFRIFVESVLYDHGMQYETQTFSKWKSGFRQDISDGP
jgi:hypothetical protein